jgi:molecular chaperone DnaK
VPASDRQNIESKLSQLREAMKGSDTNQIKSLANDVQNAFHALSQQLYAAQSAGQPGDVNPTTPQNGGNGHNPRNPDDEGEVVEGEFREM